MAVGAGMNISAGIAAVVAGATGAATLNTIDNTTEAIVRDTGDGTVTDIMATSDITIEAIDDATIDALTLATNSRTLKGFVR